jgi:hypothetical protein
VSWRSGFLLTLIIPQASSAAHAADWPVVSGFHLDVNRIGKHVWCDCRGQPPDKTWQIDQAAADDDDLRIDNVDDVSEAPCRPVEVPV